MVSMLKPFVYHTTVEIRLSPVPDPETLLVGRLDFDRMTTETVDHRTQRFEISPAHSTAHQDDAEYQAFAPLFWDKLPVKFMEELSKRSMYFTEDSIRVIHETLRAWVHCFHVEDFSISFEGWED